MANGNIKNIRDDVGCVDLNLHRCASTDEHGKVHECFAANEKDAVEGLLKKIAESNNDNDYSRRQTSSNAFTERRSVGKASSTSGVVMTDEITDSKKGDDKLVIMFIASLYHIGKSEGEGFMTGAIEPQRQAREIGHLLNDIGGYGLMKSVARRVLELLKAEGIERKRELEYCWDRIGEWRA